MSAQRTSPYRGLAEAGWRWVLDQVQHDGAGPWLPESVPGDGTVREPRAGLHSGVGGLGLALAEVRRSRPWSDEESALADEVVDVVRADVTVTTDSSWFDGLPGHLEVLGALGAAGAEDVVDRLRLLASPNGWPTSALGRPRFAEGVRITDATLGSGAVLHAAVRALADDIPGARELATFAADVLVAEVDETAEGPTWPFVPFRFRTDPPREMPNWSHGAAGIAAGLAAAGAALDRSDLVDLARRAAARLVTIGDTTDGGLRLPHFIPGLDGFGAFTYGWCHGPSGTAQLFTALEDAGVTEVAGHPPASWRDRCWHSVRASGLPARLHPGFWDNDGRCCGTAGVGDLALDADHQDFAGVLADALVERAYVDGPRAWWRFVEHRNDEPLLPPGVGWMQGAAGIAGFLFRYDRVTGAGRAR